MTELGGVELIITMMKSFLDDPDAQESGCNAIENLSQYQELVGSINKAGAGWLYQWPQRNMMTMKASSSMPVLHQRISGKHAGPFQDVLPLPINHYWC